MYKHCSFSYGPYYSSLLLSIYLLLVLKVVRLKSKSFSSIFAWTAFKSPQKSSVTYFYHQDAFNMYLVKTNTCRCEFYMVGHFSLTLKMVAISLKN